MVKHNYANFFEVLEYAADNKLNPDEALEHFRSIGRAPPLQEREVHPVPDGYTVPYHTWELKEKAQERAKSLYSVQEVVDVAEKELEELMLDMIHSGKSGKEFNFMFHCFPVGKGNYENGFVMVPSQKDSTVIVLDAAEFVTLDSSRGDIEAKIPVNIKEENND